MDDIKFRAWYPTVKKMRHFSNGEIIADGLNRYGMFFPCNEGSVFLSNCEVMRYAGASDKNGIDIYEGDIVKTTSDVIGYEYDGFIGEVKFMENGFYLDNGKDAVPLYNECGELEVLGNIRENSDLLGGDGS